LAGDLIAIGRVEINFSPLVVALIAVHRSTNFRGVSRQASLPHLGRDQDVGDHCRSIGWPLIPADDVTGCSHEIQK